MNFRSEVALSAQKDTRAFFVLMAATFTVSLGYGVVLPLLPYLLERLLPRASSSATAWHIGMLASVYMFAVFLFAPLWGLLSDRVGRRPLMLIGLGGYVFTLLLLGFSSSLWFAYLMRALAGAYVAAVLPVASAFISDTSSGEQRARRLAWMGASSLMGFLVGPAVGGGMSHMGRAIGPGPMSIPGVICLPLYAAAIIGAAVWAAMYVQLPRTLPPTKDNATVPSRFGGKPQLLRLLVLSLLVTFGLGSFEVGMVLQAKQRLGWSSAMLALMFAECSVVMIAVQVILFIPAVKAFPGHRLIVPAFIALAIGFTVIPGAVALFAMLVVVGLIAAASGLLMPALTHMISIQTALPLGAALGLQTALSSLGQGVGSAAVGALYGAFGDRFFLLSAGVMTLGALVGVGIASSSPRPDAPEEAH